MENKIILNLTNEEITELYEEFITKNIIELSSTYWYVACDNGRSGYFYEPNWYSNRGYYDWSCEAGHACGNICCSTSAGSRCNVCGPNRCGYSYAN